MGPIKRKSIQRRRRRNRKTRKTRKTYSGGKLSFDTHKPVFPPKDINDMVTHVIYINLNKRVDRRKHIERELSVFEPSKVTRLAAIEDPIPTTGCAKSHLKAVQMARDAGYPNVLILEDDAFWQNIEKAYPVLQRLISQPYDGIMFAGLNSVYDHDTLRLHSGVSATGYIVHENFYPTLIKLFEDAISHPELKRKNSAGSHVWADGVTQEAFTKGAWYITVPFLMSQIPGFSNLDRTSVNWVNAFAAPGT